jgi:hypothetical protein
MMCRSVVKPENKSNSKRVSMALAALLTVIGTHKPTSTTHARADADACAREHAHERTHARAHRGTGPNKHTGTRMHAAPCPVQVVFTLFVCPATLIDLTSMVQATSDPSVALAFAQHVAASEKKHRCSFPPPRRRSSGVPW